MTHIISGFFLFLHALGWAFLACLWTMLLLGCYNLLLFKPRTKKQHRELDQFEFEIGLACGIIVFFLLLFP